MIPEKKRFVKENISPINTANCIKGKFLDATR